MTLDGDFAEKLKNVLSDPEALAKITAIASGLGASQPSASQTPPPQKEESASPPDQGIASALTALSLPSAQSGDPRLALLVSLKPLLREDRRDRVDALAQALTLASVMKNFRK